jgi:molecular chaperone IbpA
MSQHNFFKSLNEDFQMNFDFSPLYRTTIGFDHLANLLDTLHASDRNQPSYPPYNIELLESDRYRITMAVAGFGEEDISLQVENCTLTVSAQRESKEDTVKPTYLHQGIAERSFRRQFKLADHVKVIEAALNNGLLHVYLEKQVPEAMKPRTIPINGNKIQRLAAAS